MNTRNTDFRTLSDVRLQLELGDMLAARRAKQEAARELRIRKLPTPEQPEPVNCCATQVDDIETWRDVAVFYVGVVACLAGWGLFGWAVVSVLEMLAALWGAK